MRSRTYLAIDLKSFYASVECRERDLDPLDTHLVVADETRTDKTICLAVTPSLKSYGISGRGRLFEVRQRVKQVNAERQRRAPGHTFTGASYSAAELRENPSLAMDFIIAPPHMAHYMAYSSRIYAIYMKYVAPEDMVVYSIDEVFMDVTGYLETYGLTARELARKIILDVLNTTGITATAGIGTNLFLCKVAMDIVAKHVPADRDGVRIAELDERRFRHELWSYQPLTDFWRVGRGTAKKLEQYGMCTMGDIALCSEKNENLLYKLFGKNAELLIDHAWGWEPCTVADIKAYKPSTNSISTGQVLACPYTADKARLVVREMADQLALDLVSKGLVTDRLVLTVGYDIDNLNDPARRINYHGRTETDRYGRTLPKSAHGTQSLGELTSSTQKLMDAATVLFDRIIDPNLLIRRMYLVANHVIPESDAPQPARCEQLDLFTDYAAEQERLRQIAEEKARIRQQEALRKKQQETLRKQEEERQKVLAEQRKKQIIIQKYGQKWGTSILNGKVELGMTKQMCREVINIKSYDIGKSSHRGHVIETWTFNKAKHDLQIAMSPRSGEEAAALLFLAGLAGAFGVEMSAPQYSILVFTDGKLTSLY